MHLINITTMYDHVDKGVRVRPLWAGAIADEILRDQYSTPCFLGLVRPWYAAVTYRRITEALVSTEMLLNSNATAFSIWIVSRFKISSVLSKNPTLRIGAVHERPMLDMRTHTQGSGFVYHMHGFSNC